MAPFKAIITQQGKRGIFPSMRGEIYEHDVQIGTFSRAAMRNYVPPIESKFFSERSKLRFDAQADCLTTEEIIEALTSPPL